MKCSKCKIDYQENETHEHHTHPKFMSNKDGTGMKVYLCKKCHDILHFTLPKLYWDILTEGQKTEAIRRVIGYSKKYGGLK